MTDPEFADATYVEPITPEFVEKVIAKERPDALLRHARRPDRAQRRAIALHEARRARASTSVELIGADVDAIQRGENREPFKDIVEGAARARHAESARSDICHTMDDVPGRAADARLPRRRAALVHAWAAPAPGFAYDEDDLRRIAGAGPATLADHRGAPRGVDPRLEGVRARGDARQGRQRRDRLLDRERRPDGRAHRRLDHRRAGA